MTVEQVELGIVIVQLQRITPTLRWMRAALTSLLELFKMPTTSPSPAPETK